MLKLDQLSSRQIFGFFGLLCAGALGYAFYAEHVLGLVPCPLCMFQRVAVIAFGSTCVLALLHGPKGWGIRVYATLALLFNILGAAIAGRHVWLQTLPKDQVPSCAPPLDYMWDNFPFGNMLKTVLMTSGECANIDWRFLGFSMPAWTFAFFAIMGLMLILLLLFPPGRERAFAGK
jgi:protein dithiol:quinone oxidoreductase